MIVLTKEQSKTLTLLKGFAIILVVMIHCDVEWNICLDSTYICRD